MEYIIIIFYMLIVVIVGVVLVGMIVGIHFLRIVKENVSDFFKYSSKRGKGFLVLAILGTLWCGICIYSWREDMDMISDYKEIAENEPDRKNEALERLEIWENNHKLTITLTVPSLIVTATSAMIYICKNMK